MPSFEPAFGGLTEMTGSGVGVASPDDDLLVQTREEDEEENEEDKGECEEAEEESEEDEEESEEGEEENQEDEIDEDDSHIPPQELLEKLDAVSSALSAKGFVEANTAAQQAFLQKFGRYIASKPPTNRNNVLHMMAADRSAIPWLIRHILKHYSARMDDKDNAGRQPLTVAIQVNKEEFIKAVLDSEYDDKNLQWILGSPSSDSGNSIHDAIKNGLNPKLTVDLINKVSGDLLSTRDNLGRTPLHCAVEYERCSKTQLNVVNALMSRSDLALDKKTNAHLSVYQHHISTRPKQYRPAARKASAPAPALKPREQAPRQSHDKGMPEKKRQQSIETEESLKIVGQNYSDGLLPAQNPTPYRDMRSSGLRRALTFKSLSADCEAVSLTCPPSPTSHNCQESESREAMTTLNPQAKSKKAAYSTSPNSGSKGPRSSATKKQGKTVKKKSTDSAPVYSEYADQIASAVKLQYLRSTFENRTESEQRSHETAMNFLYGDSRTKHICFDLLQKENVMSLKSLKSGSYSQFDFDHVLQYVAVGPIIFRAEGQPALPEKGRRDMVKLFNWLKDKNVTNIIKVIVDDRKGPFHSDEAIIEALSPFIVEILDWSKPDLCPETIQKACANVRELHLSWTGLNGMLFAWGGIDGLANLPYLTDIYIRQTQEPEPEAWISEKLDEFNRRLCKSRDRIISERSTNSSNAMPRYGLPLFPEIKVHRPSNSITDGDGQITAGAVSEQRRGPEFKDHQWLKIMDRFAAGIFSLSPDGLIKKLNLPVELQRDVRICLIDDGVDAEHRSIAERMDGEMGRAFGAYTKDEYRGMTMPFYDSTTNHGTLMASMMARVCPNVKIVSYRLDTRQGEDQKVRFTAKSAADALEQAAKQDFDIISISWIVRKETISVENNLRDIFRLENALRLAVKDKLVFCSAPDMGEITSDELMSYYPIGASIPELFKIGAAKADNRPWGPAGAQTAVNYFLPGHDVREKEGDEVILGDRSLMSESSIATALAAGLAALMIHVVRMATIRTYELNKQDSAEANILKLISLKAIKSHATMRKTFDSMTKTNDKEKYVHTWVHFNRKGHELMAAGEAIRTEDEKWRVISELARDIVDSKYMDETSHQQVSNFEPIRV
ncbi:hypothetical protein B0T17DRAFT_69929 [Bombardia bombarda]|uniref:Peptidase S8/S53 domain-containing protein n=1 Tax=Bombardia bombarda TaxID=252184 RepID=A0AA39XLC7_9PEZI|nr:hypothetical protein B0T17DRAFT_69929 [Bombardia bombarda]